MNGEFLWCTAEKSVLIHNIFSPHIKIHEKKINKCFFGAKSCQYDCNVRI